MAVLLATITDLSRQGCLSEGKTKGYTGCVEWWMKLMRYDYQDRVHLCSRSIICTCLWPFCLIVSESLPANCGLLYSSELVYNSGWVQLITHSPMVKLSGWTNVWRRFFTVTFVRARQSGVTCSILRSFGTTVALIRPWEGHHLKFSMDLCPTILAYQWLMCLQWQTWTNGWMRGSWWPTWFGSICCGPNNGWKKLLISIVHSVFSLLVSGSFSNCSPMSNPLWLRVRIKSLHSNFLAPTRLWRRWVKWPIIWHC